jgi:FtsP/CotA-like multicopper oxidase with cupredoxin domain
VTSARCAPRCAVIAAALVACACGRPAPASDLRLPRPSPDRLPASAATSPGPTGAAASDFCPADPDSATAIGAPSTDLYCIELIPPPHLFGRADGVVQLAPSPTPFTVAVTRDGRHRHRTTFFIRGLPDPAELGSGLTTYIAWAAPLSLYPLTRLGTVRNGRVDGGELALNKFYILVSAEAADTVSERRGPLVLRGLSPSTRMRDPHFLIMSGDPAARADVHAHDRHGGWTMPPHDPRVAQTPMGVEHLVPQATPFLPGAGVNAATLPLVRARELIEATDGDTIRLRAGLVRRRIRGRDVVMYAFNGQQPGPLVHVRQAATITIDFHNDTPHETAVHWHGVRLDNRFDGVPHVTQEPVPPGGTFRYTVHFPDAGIYWYHPHHREDVQQDLGLYGNLLVRSTEPNYFGPAHREEVLMLDDLLVGDDGIVPYGGEHTTFALMGRFGNVLLVNGEPRYALDAQLGEVVRFHLTNASNTRTFNVAIDSARMKIVASDVGRFQREEWVESVVIAPAERYVIDVRFERAGTAALTNRVQAIDHMMGAFLPMVDTLGTITVAGTSPATDLSASFDSLRAPRAVAADIERYRAHFNREPDLMLDLLLEERGLPWEMVRVMRLDTLYFHPVEWAGTMPMMDWLATGAQVRWVLRDVASGAANDAIRWRFRVGDVVRVRLRNQRHSLHAMQHPIHIHGQRFLTLAVNGVATDNLVWKDTVLVPVGSTVDLLLELSNPGRWMVHCHIAEHLEAGMQFVLDVAR